VKKIAGKGLTAMKLVPGKSMDEIDRISFDAGPAPMDSRATPTALRAGAAEHPAGAPVATLDGAWQMAEGGAESARLAGQWRDAIPAQVPGSVHAALVAAGKMPDPTVGRNQPIVAQASYKTWWFRTTFGRPQGAQGERLVFDGVCNRCTVWLNGRRLGGHEGMFGGPSFDVAGLLKDENTLVVKLDPIPRKHDGVFFETDFNNTSWKETVVFNNVYGWHYSQCPSLGIWRSVRIEGAPAVRMEHPFVATRDARKGLVDLVVTLKGPADRWSGALKGTIAPENFEGFARTFTVPVASRQAARTLHLRFRIPAPRLWWPVDRGAPNLYRMTLSFVPDSSGPAAPDTQSFTFGIRTVQMAPLPGGPRPDKYNWTFVINGKPMFVKGTGWCTMDPLMDFSRARYDRFLSLARDQHCQMVRGWGSGMPETDEFYDLCDRYGIMVMQEWPTAWNSHETQPYGMLEETVRLNTLRLRNRPSLVMWGAGNESGKPFGRAIDMMGRLALELDGTRPFHRGEPWGGSLHNYDSYWGRQPLDEHLRKEADFFGEYGLACFPVYESVQRYLPDNEKQVWPPPADGAFAFHTPIFNTVQCLSRIGQFAHTFAPKNGSMEQFVIGSQMAQVVCLRHQYDRARSRWPQCTGSLYYKLNDNFPAASWSTADWYGAPKMSHYFMKQVLAPLHACLTFSTVHSLGMWFNQPVFLLDDANSLKGRAWQVTVRAFNRELSEIKQTSFEGRGSIASPRMVGRFELDTEQTDTAPLLIVSEVKTDGELADRTFCWINYEFDKGCLFRLSRTTLALQVEAGRVRLTNTGALPAVAAEVRRPGHLDTFTASDNCLWLDPGQSVWVTVNSTEGLTAGAWNA
jgi:beta-mannosidase